jgi:hypothetical protein
MYRYAGITIEIYNGRFGTCPVNSETSIDGTVNRRKSIFFNNAMRHMILGQNFPKKKLLMNWDNFRRSTEF